MAFKLRSLQQSLEQEEAEHKATKAKLADKNTIYQSIEEAKSEALKGEQVLKVATGWIASSACSQEFKQYFTELNHRYWDKRHERAQVSS